MTLDTGPAVTTTLLHHPTVPSPLANRVPVLLVYKLGHYLLAPGALAW